MPGQNAGTVLLFRTPHGNGAMYLHAGAIEDQLHGIVAGFTHEALAVTEWLVQPDTTVSSAYWPE